MTVLDFGSLDLIDGEIVRLEALGTDSGTDWGKPQPIETQLNSFVQYGALVASEGWENRVVMIAVVAQSEDADSINDAELALAGEVGKPNTLKFQPPNGLVPTVYKVLTSHFDKVPDDLALVTAGEQVFMLRLVCDPFAYSDGETVVEALGPPPGTPPVEVSVDNGTSTSGWDAGYNNSPLSPATSTNAGRTLVGASTPATAGQVRLYMRRTGAVDVSATKYIVVDWAYSGGYPVGGLSAAVTTGTPLTLSKVSEGASPVAGDMRSVFKVPASVSSLADLTFTHTTTGVRGGSGGFSDLISAVVPRSLFVDQVTRADRVSAATGKQQLRSFTVGGSAPTTGSIELAHDTAALGDGVLIYTYSADGLGGAGYTPQCTQFRISGGPTPALDPTAVSGYNTLLDATDYFSFPALALPDGEYAVWARLKSASATAAVSFNFTPQLSAQIGDTVSQTVTVALGGSVWRTVPLGMMHLPLIDTGLAGRTLVGIGSANPSADDVYLDELWLYNLSLGRLTGVNLSSGTAAVGGPSRRFWNDSPSLSNDGLGALMRGHSADRSDSFSAYPSSFAPGVHEFLPGPMKMHLVTPNTDGVQASFRYTKAWLHTAAE